MTTYETQLNNDLQWALREGSMHFEGGSAVHETLRRLVTKLDELEVDYAIAGDMAMFFHGYRRFTEQVELLVTADGLGQIGTKLTALGYERLSSKSKIIRDKATGVKIVFLVSGRYPVEGALDRISIPLPKEAATELDGMHVISLSKIIELKISTGHLQRVGHDLADVQSLIQVLNLPKNFAEQFEPDLRVWYESIWLEAQRAIAYDHEEFPDLSPPTP